MKKVVFLGMGGTIAGRATSASDNVGYTAGQIPIEDLLLAAPDLKHLLQGYAADAEQIAQMDSKDMTHAGWRLLLLRVVQLLSDAAVHAIVVTHGTDTLEETAYFLSQTIPLDLQSTKAVVMTCAMRPATSSFADGPQNLADAVAVAISPGAMGVSVVCAGYLHAAHAVQKVHPYRLDAFDSGEVGPLGVVEEGVLRMFRPWPVDTPVFGVGLLAQTLPTTPWPRVEVVMSHAGSDGAIIKSLCAYRSETPLQGIVVVGTGNGTLHRELVDALELAVHSGIKVVLTTRCQAGAIVGKAGGSGTEIPALSLSPAKARIFLMLQLMTTVQRPSS
jgi:L-asparaginase